MFGHRLRSHLDLLMPSATTRANAKQQQQKVNLVNREFAVYIRNFRGIPQWIPGIVDKCCGPVSYPVKLNDGVIITTC